MKAVFLDRDGTVIVDPRDERVDTIEEVELFPETLEALGQLATLNYGVFFVTNQAGIAEGRFTIDDYQKIQAEVLVEIAPSGVSILKTYMCPHAIDGGCECRKPKPKMILDAAKEFDIDLAESYMIGDRESDILTGINAGTRTIRVKTGNSPFESSEADFVANNLLEAVRYIASQGLYNKRI